MPCVAPGPGPRDVNPWSLFSCQSRGGVTATPRINPAGGRDHWPQCWSVVMAGGGIKPGITYGASDEYGYGVAQDGVHVAVTIEDHGIGIPESEQEQVFERYYRGSNTSGIVGSGVGLYLVRTIIELHKGSVALHSREGAGSRFTVQLPALAAEIQTLRADPECDVTRRGSTFS